MKALLISSLPVVLMEMEVTDVVIAGKDSYVSDKDSFAVWMSSRHAKQIKKHDMIKVLCIPEDCLRNTRHVFAVSIKKSGEGFYIPLFNTGDFSAKMFDDLTIKAM